MTTRRGFLHVAGAGPGAATLGSFPSLQGCNRLRREDGCPSFNVNFHAVNKRGEFGAAAVWSGSRYAVSVEGRGELRDAAYVYERQD